LRGTRAAVSHAIWARDEDPHIFSRAPFLHSNSARPISLLGTAEEICLEYERSLSVTWWGSCMSTYIAWHQHTGCLKISHVHAPGRQTQKILTIGCMITQPYHSQPAPHYEKPIHPQEYESKAKCFWPSRGLEGRAAGAWLLRAIR
jgi:hypothetical protein